MRRAAQALSAAATPARSARGRPKSESSPAAFLADGGAPGKKLLRASFAGWPFRGSGQSALRSQAQSNSHRKTLSMVQMLMEVKNPYILAMDMLHTTRRDAAMGCSRGLAMISEETPSSLASPTTQSAAQPSSSTATGGLAPGRAGSETAGVRSGLSRLSHLELEPQRSAQVGVDWIGASRRTQSTAFFVPPGRVRAWAIPRACCGKAALLTRTLNEALNWPESALFVLEPSLAQAEDLGRRGLISPASVFSAPHHAFSAAVSMLDMQYAASSFVPAYSHAGLMLVTQPLRPKQPSAVATVQPIARTLFVQPNMQLLAFYQPAVPARSPRAGPDPDSAGAGSRGASKPANAVLKCSIGHLSVRLGAHSVAGVLMATTSFVKVRCAN